MNALRAAKVPMMGATVTADNLASAAQVGFFRVSAPNSDQASAAVRYLRQQQTAHPGYQVLVVRDRAEDDIYNTSLYKDFERSAAAQHLTVIRGDREYVSGADGVSNAFSAVADQVYDIKPDAVFFARPGDRPAQLHHGDGGARAAVRDHGGDRGRRDGGLLGGGRGQGRA